MPWDNGNMVHDHNEKEIRQRAYYMKGIKEEYKVIIIIQNIPGNTDNEGNKPFSFFLFSFSLSQWSGYVIDNILVT